MTSEYHPLASPTYPLPRTPEARLLDVLRGYADVNLIARKETLTVETRLSDRALRDAVRNLRDAGWPVCSSSAQDEPGYWLSTDPEEVAACAEREYGSRIRSELRTRSAMRRAARVLRAQREAFEPVQGQLPA